VLHVLYASETGNGEELVERIAPPAARSAGIGVRVREIDAVSLDELAAMHWVLIVISTTGQGDVPFDTEELWDALIAADAPSLDDMRFGVLALGDRVYADFCQAGIELDDRLAELGAHRLVDLVTCDYDYETPASHWLREGIAAVAADMAASTGTRGLVDGETSTGGGTAVDGEPSADRGEGTVEHAEFGSPAVSGPIADEPEPLRIPDPASRAVGSARIAGIRTLSDADPDREILHVTLELPETVAQASADQASADPPHPDHSRTGAGAAGTTGGTGAPAWQVGDSLDLLVPNDQDLVAAVLAHLGIDPEHEVSDGTTTLSAARLLTERLELRQLPRSLFEAIVERTGDEELGRMIRSRDAEFERWRRGRDLLAVLQVVPQLRADAEDLVRWLRPLQTRAYSIASSPVVDAGRADLTVRTIRYEQDGRRCEGTASGALSRMARSAGRGAPQPDEQHNDGSRSVLVRLRPAPGFHLPEDPLADVVMIGPGVGVAPFRGFLQERRARGDTGRSWLLCGIRERGRDLLYGEELAELREAGALTRLDIAESRAARGAEYVQHMIQRLGAELFAWIDGGAHVFVCGDAREMAPAVRLALRSVATRQLGSPETGMAWMTRLQGERRYREDVY
jgi:sulfite reductase (NADPH) flavoprotein alpha-component